MSLEKVHILPSEKTPEIDLNPNGSIKISGRAIDENIRKAPEQVMNWLENYISDPAEKTDVTVALEYLNSFNTIILTSILRKIYQVKQKSKDIVIKWYIENDDDDLRDRGESISTAFNLPIEFYGVEDIKSMY
jgi:hypothetical protein